MAASVDDDQEDNNDDGANDETAPADERRLIGGLIGLTFTVCLAAMTTAVCNYKRQPLFKRVKESLRLRGSSSSSSDQQ